MGLATAVANGTTSIIATAAGVSGSATLTVAQAVSYVTVSPLADTISIGITRQFTASARDANGNAIAAQTSISSSSLPAVATVDGSGLATGLSDGTTNIFARTAGVSGAASLTVTSIALARWLPSSGWSPGNRAEGRALRPTAQLR